MQEILLRDHVEIEKRRDDFARLDRINGVEKALAILQTKFEGALERAVSGEDLKDLKREVEADVKAQSSDIMEQVKGLLLSQQVANASLMEATRQERERENRHLRNQFFLMLVGTAVSIIGTLLFLGR